MKKIYPFNVRVYGLLINPSGEVLICDEDIDNWHITKFPGGGVEFGEGLHEALLREFKEETDTNVTIVRHFYTTDFFVPSAIDASTQVISIFYLVQPLNGCFHLPPNTIQNNGRVHIRFRWVGIAALQPDEVTYAIEKKVVQLLKEQFE
ncbi:MAG TPA: NUDIX hydrolase [Chitinophagales bacterium]|nr:NUDIX hydrolase [Chitinophagales bacterium]HRK29347.1 NUDIX hydrolase [Chitinophagales bacterium]